MIIIGKTIPFGNVAPLPLRGFPPGRTRIRQRGGELVKVRVRTEAGILEYIVKEIDGHWEPHHVTGSNRTEKP